MNIRRVPRTAVLVCGALAMIHSTVAPAVPFDGSSAGNAGYSAKQLLLDGFSAGDGIYWIDPDGNGGNSPFQIFADMTTTGGGWTLGLNSLKDDASSTTDMVSNTGTVGIDSGHTRDMTALAIAQQAQIRHRLLGIDGDVLFDGYYTGDYHGTMADTTDWTVIAGSFSNVRLSYHAGKDWSSSSADVDDYFGNCAALFGVPWYYGTCWTTIPVQYSESLPLDSPIDSITGSYSAIGQYSIYVRELDSPSLGASSAQAVTEPATTALLALSLLGARCARRRRAH